MAIVCLARFAADGASATVRLGRSPVIVGARCAGRRAPHRRRGGPPRRHDGRSDGRVRSRRTRRRQGQADVRRRPRPHGQRTPTAGAVDVVRRVTIAPAATSAVDSPQPRHRLGAAAEGRGRVARRQASWWLDPASTSHRPRRRDDGCASLVAGAGVVRAAKARRCRDRAAGAWTSRTTSIPATYARPYELPGGQDVLRRTRRFDVRSWSCHEAARRSRCSWTATRRRRATPSRAGRA